MEEHELPLVTVYTCVYNMADKVRRAFDSVKAQTYPNIEHIVVDDGSTDGLEELARRYQSEAAYPVRYYRQENRGKYAACNLAWDKANGEFLYNIDADDELLPHAVAFLVGQWFQIPAAHREEYWCVRGRCIDQLEGKLIGPPYPEHINELPWEEARREAAKVRAEQSSLKRRAALERYRYPEPIGVKKILESVVWKQVGQKYRAWYTNEPVRIYHIHEGHTLSSPSRTPQGCSDRCWDAKWQLLHRKEFPCSYAKQLARYALCRQLATPLYRKHNPYLREFGVPTQVLLVLLWPSAALIGLILRRKWKDRQ